MDQQQKNRKTTLKILLIFGGILILVLIGAVIYFYAIGDTNKNNNTTTNIACGCYVIDPAVVNDCGDPKRAFLFNINKVSSDQTCSAQCDNNQISENLLNSSTPKDSYKSCTVKSIADTRCENMILKDQDGKIITGKISETDSINVEATFDSASYTDYIFKVNSNTIQPDNIDGNKISKSITDLGSTDSIEILATATDSQGDSINSIVCRRVVDINRSSSSNVNSLAITTDKKSDGTTQLSQVSISAGQLASDNVKVKFSFSNNATPIVATDGLTVSTSKGSITMSKVDLYNSANFDGGNSFSILDSYTGDLTITAEVYVDGTSIGTSSTDIAFAEPSGSNDQNSDNTDGETDTTKSDFSVTKSVTPQCVERVDGKDNAKFTITVKNNKATADTVTSIKDKLPLGFTYTTASTLINGSSVSDDSLVTVTPVGDSQEIVWEPSTAWTIDANSTLIIVFDSVAGDSAITGQNQNEVIVNPASVPDDPDTLRAEATITVAQDCNNPEENNNVPNTGIFDSTIVRILAGVAIVLTGWLVYTRPEGIRLSKAIVGSGAYKDAELVKYKLTNPRKYFEEKTLRSKSKEKK